MAKKRDRPARTRKHRKQPGSSPASPNEPQRAGRKALDILSAVAPGPASAIGSYPRILAEQPPAQPAGADVDDKHGHDDRQQDRADVGIIEFPDRHHEFLPDAAGADEPHHR